MCICKKSFVFKPISNELNIIVDWNVSFNKSLNISYFEMDK